MVNEQILLFVIPRPGDCDKIGKNVFPYPPLAEVSRSDGGGHYSIDGGTVALVPPYESERGYFMKMKII
jgi:hypothetical protein